MSVKIIADSTCDLPDELLAQYDISILPLYIQMGGRCYRDRVEITPREVFAHVDAGGALCTTSSVNMDEFRDYFALWAKTREAVVCITLSGEMSSCFQNACRAAEGFDNVYVVDSRNLSSAQGLLALEGARLAREGCSGLEIADLLRAETTKVQSSFLLDRLDYMRRGGRCSAVAALGANLMHLKPCIAVHDGAMGVVKKRRGSFERCWMHAPPARDMAIVVHHAAIRTLEEDVRFRAVYEARTGCTVACHCGPNTIGVMFLNK